MPTLWDRESVNTNPILDSLGEIIGSPPLLVQSLGEFVDVVVDGADVGIGALDAADH
jgi:hypothetical protein